MEALNNKKILVGMTLTFGLIISFPVEKELVYAETQNEIEENRAEIQSELEDKKQDLQDVQAELIALNEDIARVDETIEENENKIKETEVEIETKQEELKIKEQEVKELEEDIDKRFEILKDRASSLQKSGGSAGYLEVIFGSESFTDFIDRVSLVSKIAKADSNLIDQFEADKEELEVQKAKVEEELAELSAMQEELTLMQAQILEQKEENEAKKETLNEKEKASQSIIAELELEDSELAQLEEQAKAQAEEANSQVIEQYAATTSTSSSSSSSNSSTSTTSSTVTVKSSGNASSIMSAGYKYIGNSAYKFGGGRTSSDIANGLFDCSGFVSWAFAQGGISVPASTSGLSGVGQKVSTSDMQPGDLVFFNTYKTNGHVGIYLGGNQFIGSQSSTGVAVANMGSGYWADKFSGHVRRVN
ncbi:coiled-coil domain-containing protein [Paraliobacillus zengyii]|uniref:coiled-coil domain-containing protein n=1 Tax=Paraliobacillus zengyii TaxID=2213194 RepID=UPI000E3E9301|nr:C40 family peptidase [Paraliobacillus zengyii]